MFEFASRSSTTTDVPATTERPGIKDKLRALHLRTGIPTEMTSRSDSPNRSISDAGSEHSHRSGPSHVAWISDKGASSMSLDAPIIGRSASSPPQSRPSPCFTSNRPAKLYIHPSSRSTHSLRLDSRSAWGPEDSYYFPGIKPLSPIAEQDYFSPERRPLPLPVEQLSQASTPDGSQHSGITRPSPVFSTFITRPLNRTHSQNSSRSTSSAPPCIPPLDLRPVFPGSQPLRTTKSAILQTMPTISGSLEDALGPFDDGSSLRAESFKTAHSVDNPAPGADLERGIALGDGYTDRHEPGGSQVELSSMPSIRSIPRSASSSSSFFDRRWRRSESMGSGLALASFPKVHKPRFGVSMTPAKWLFWLGFIAPWCWMIGGWYYTIRGERRPRISAKKKNPLLSTWIVPRRRDRDGAQLEEKEAVVHGVWFGYPFVLVPDEADLTRTTSGSTRSRRSPPTIRTKERTVLDPWIFRCRIAALVGGVALVIAFVVAFVVIGRTA